MRMTTYCLYIFEYLNDVIGQTDLFFHLQCLLSRVAYLYLHTKP